MADEKSALIQLLIELQDRISEPLEHVQHSLEDTQHSFAEIGAAAAEVFAGFEALEHIIEPAMEMQDAQVRLAQATDATKEALAEAKEQAEALSTSYNRSAEDITAAQTTLSRYTGSLEAAQESMKATAQISNIFGVSANEAAKLLGPAMQTIGDATLPVAERMQQVADKIAVLAKSMSPDAGAGMARSLGQAAGAAKQLGLSVDQTLASIAVLTKSGAVRNAGTSFATMAEELLKVGKDGQNAFQKANVPLVRFSNGQVNLIATLRRLQAQGPKAVQAFEKGLGSSGRLLALLMQNLDGVADGTQKLHHAEGEAAKEAEKNQGTLSQQLGDLHNAVSNLGDAFGTPLLAPLTYAVKQVTEFINVVKEFAEAHPVITGLISNFLGIVAALVAVQGALRVAMMGLRMFRGVSLVAMGPMMLLAAAAVAAAIAIYQNWGWVKEKLGEIWTWFSNTSFGQGVISTARRVAEVAREIPAAWDWVKQKLGEVWAWFENTTWAQVLLAALAPFIGIPAAIVANWDEIKAYFGPLWDDVKARFTAALPSMQQVTDWLKSVVAEVQAAWQPVKAFFQQLWDGVVAVFQSALGKIQPVIDAIKGTVDLARSVGGKVASALGISSGPKEGASGSGPTAAAAPTLATSAPAGTGGAPAAAVNNNVDSHNTVTINVQGSADPNATAQAVSDRLAEQTRQNARLGFEGAPS